MPLSAKGEEIRAALEKTYGSEGRQDASFRPCPRDGFATKQEAKQAGLAAGIPADEVDVFAGPATTTTLTRWNYRTLASRRDADTGIDGAALDGILAKCDALGARVDALVARRDAASVEPGQKVKITYGAYAGKSGTVVELSPSGMFAIVKVAGKILSYDCSDLKPA